MKRGYMIKNTLESVKKHQICIKPIETLSAFRGIRWLLQNRNPDGGWGRTEPDGLGKSVSWRTALAVWTLSEYGLANSEYKAGIKWLVDNQNSNDGGWGARKGDDSKTWLTAMAVKALSSSSNSDSTITDSLKRAIEWLLRNQVGKGGWGLFPGDTSKSYSTALVIVSLKNIKEERVVAAVNGGVEWLKQTLDSRGWNEAFDVICFGVWALGEKSEQVRSRISDGFQILEGEFAKKSPLDFAALSMLALSECNITLEDRSLFQSFSYAVQNQNSDGSWNPESKNKAGKTGTTSLVLLGYSRLGEANCLVCDSDMDNRLERAASLDLDNLHSKVYSRFQLLRKLLYAFLGFLGLSVSGIIMLAWKTAMLNQSDFLTLITAWISIFLVLCGGIIKYARISENS